VNSDPPSASEEGGEERKTTVSMLTAAIGQSNVIRKDEDDLRSIRIIRDGAVVEIPWVQALALEGRLYGVGPGATALGVAVGPFGAGAIDLTEIDYLQTIPVTVAVLPVYIRVCLVAVGTVLESGFHAFWGSAGIIGANSVAVTPHNLKPGSNLASLCTVACLGDAGGTAFAPAGLIAREVTTMLTGIAASPQPFIPAWSAATAGFVTVLEGLASPGRQIAMFVDGQAPSGYIHHVWAELPVGDILT